MKHLKQFGLMIGAMAVLAAPALAAPKVGEAAPDFSAKDAKGQMFKLSDHQDKIVVLEWTNHDCPFVKKHYSGGNMQALQKEATAMGGVAWIAINSSAAGRQGNVSDTEIVKILADKGATPTTIIRDENGKIGKLYDAKTTPHMFIIDKGGKLAYAGAIDDNSSPRASTIKSAKNYVMAALNNLKSGQPVDVASTQPYGCSVKY